MAALTPRPSPVLLDLGPVVGANISFFGERLACKLYVEDLFAEIEAMHRRGVADTMSTALVARLRHADEAIDGILCWDLFDFLDRATGLAMAARLMKMLKPGGAVHAMFGTTATELTHYTRFVVEGGASLRQRPYPATRVKRHVRQMGEISKLFDNLKVTESVLLKTSTRETLFRK
jgi:predicted SAM-dependent methyltransferase